MAAIYKMLVVEARYLPDRLFYELVRVFKPRDDGYELFTYKAGLSSEHRKEIEDWVEERAKKNGLEMPECAILLHFLYGYDTYKFNRPERWENDRYKNATVGV